MYSISFDLEIITPFFMAGAYGKNPELRPSSFKGMIRFWWRAMRAEDDIPTLLKNEAILFGGTGEGQSKSKLILRSFPISHKIGNNLKNDMNLKDYSGVGYLLYSTFMQRGKERSYLKPQSRFKLVMSSRDKEALFQAEAAFWLAVNLGGFGTRARRGGGNLDVIKCLGINSEHTDELLMRYIIKTNDIQVHLKSGYEKARNTIKQQGITTKYSNLSGARIFIGKSFSNWKLALNTVGHSLLEYRLKKKPDYNIFVDFLRRRPNDDFLERVKFGLPLSGRFNNNPAVKGKVFMVEAGQQITRRSSPLIIKIIKFTGSFVPVLIILEGQFLPDDVKLILKDKSKAMPKQRPQSKDYTGNNVIEDFIKSKLSSFNEVKL